MTVVSRCEQYQIMGVICGAIDLVLIILTCIAWVNTQNVIWAILFVAELIAPILIGTYFYKKWENNSRYLSDEDFYKKKWPIVLQGDNIFVKSHIFGFPVLIRIEYVFSTYGLTNSYEIPISRDATIEEKLETIREYKERHKPQVSKEFIDTKRMV